MRSWQKLGVFILVGLLTVGLPAHVFAQQSSSSNYSVDEAFFGTGGELEASSPGYKAGQGAGDTAAGPTKSTSFSTVLGSQTDPEPMLEFIVAGVSTDHGVLSPSTTAYGSTEVWVRTINSSGYIMQTTGLPPNQTVHTLKPLDESPTTSLPGTEQFGINLAANTTPAVGANPVQVPSDASPYGLPTGDYATSNLFMYDPDAIIAQSADGAVNGETHYTLSYIMNVSNLTPAGRYTTNISVVVTAKF